MTIYKKQPRTLAETSAATVSEASARQSSGLTSLFKGSTLAADAPRTASVRRTTGETDVLVTLGLDGTGACAIDTGVPFFDHMLNAFGRHGMFDLKVEVVGDVEVDAHHTVEDTGIVLGQAVCQALGDKRGVTRFANVAVPLDEALSRVVLDLSGRPGLVFSCSFTAPMIGALDAQLVREFFQALVNHAAMTAHIDNLRGENAHHQAETIFKAFGRALRMAVEPDARMAGVIPSTKGVL